MRRALLTLLIVTTALHAGCDQSDDNRLLTVEKTGGQLISDIGIASFPTPEGWTPNRSNGNTAVVLTRQGASQEALDEMVSIDVGNSVAGDVKSSADGLAAKFGGTSTQLPFTVDGAEAYRVSIPPDYDQLMPRECIVVHYGEKVCFIFGGSKAKADIWPVVNSVVQSWRWN